MCDSVRRNKIIVTFRDEMFKDKFKLTSFQNATCIFGTTQKNAMAITITVVI